MHVLRFFGKIACCLALCAILAGADSILLKNGHRLEGKYIGGSTTAIGFMTDGTIEYFPTSEVLVLLFGNGTNSESPLSGFQPNPMNEQSSVLPTKIELVRKRSASHPGRPGQSPRRVPAVSISRTHNDVKQDEVTGRDARLD